MIVMSFRTIENHCVQSGLEGGFIDLTVLFDNGDYDFLPFRTLDVLVCFQVS
jgi:hypothetical protein